MILDGLPQSVLRLATVVSIAARIEPELLRFARLRLLPDVDASAEADLWFSELVASRSTKRLMLLPEATEALRDNLAADSCLLNAARAIVAAAHVHAPAVVQLEEEVTYLALSGGDVETINTKLLTVLNTLAVEKRAGLSEWVARALPRLPRRVRQTATASALQLICGGEIPLVRVQRGLMSDPKLAALVVQALPTVTIWARLVPADDDLGVELSTREIPSAHPIAMPETTPLIVEITTAGQSEIVEVPPEGSVVRNVERDVSLRTIAGDVYHLIEDRPEARLMASGELREGEFVLGRVIDIQADAIIVDIGYRVDGLLPSNELIGEVKRGEAIEVLIKRLDDPSGYVLLGSTRSRDVWAEIEAAFTADGPISGRVVERVKGGLAVDVGGVKAFLPGSLIDTKPVKNLDALRGHEYKFKIVSFDKKRNNIVLSRRAIVEVEQAAAKADVFSRLQEGQHTHGTVKNITDYGVFVDLGGVDGLLHITDISWGRVNHPSEYFNVGDEIEVVVLKFDPAAERVSLGYKQRSEDPWTDIVQRYPLGSRAHGRVVSLTDYGAFIEVEEGVEGLIHVSEMSWTKKVRNPSKVLTMGAEVDAVVTDVNVQSRRMTLSLKALEPNPWDTIAERYPIGAVITGKVRNLTDFGAFVEVEDGVDGLVHISDMAWNRRLKHPNELLKKGDAVQARVINVDAENQRLTLSIKEFLPNEWDNFANSHAVGEDVIGTVAKITDFGLFIRVANGVEGLAHVSEISRDPNAKLDKTFHVGDALRVRLIKIDWADKKIGLSTRDVEPLTEDERKQFAQDTSQPAESPEQSTEN